MCKHKPESQRDTVTCVTVDQIWAALNSPDASSKCLDDEDDRRALFNLIISRSHQ